MRFMCLGWEWFFAGESSVIFKEAYGNSLLMETSLWLCGFWLVLPFYGVWALGIKIDFSIWKMPAHTGCSCSLASDDVQNGGPFWQLYNPAVHRADLPHSSMVEWAQPCTDAKKSLHLQHLDVSFRDSTSFPRGGREWWPQSSFAAVFVRLGIFPPTSQSVSLLLSRGLGRSLAGWAA